LNIARVLSRAREALRDRDYEIVLVDDGSEDDTVAVAQRALGDDAARLRVVSHRYKSGYAKTVCDGLRSSRGGVLAFMDGDGQFDPADLKPLLERLHAADLVTGYR